MKKIITLTIITFYFLAGNLYSKTDFAIVAKSVNTNLEIAKEAALSQISEQIVVAVKSSFTSMETSVNNEQNVALYALVETGSEGFLYGVEYYGISQNKKKEYIVQAGITKDNLLSTASNLSYGINNKITPLKQKIYDKTPTYYKEEYRKVVFLDALVSYLKTHQMTFNDTTFNARKEYMNLLEDIYYSNASIKINVIQPKNLKRFHVVSDILIDFWKYSDLPNHTLVFVQGGTYAYKIDSKKYTPVDNQVDISAGYNQVLNIYLRPKLLKKVDLSVNITYKNATIKQYHNTLMGNIKNYFSSNQFDIVKSNEDYSLHLEFQASSKTNLTDTYSIVSYPILIELYGKRRNLLYSNSISVDYLPLKQDNNILVPLPFLTKNIEENLNILIGEILTAINYN